MLKRVISFVLVFAMVFSLAGTVGAYPYADPEAGQNSPQTEEHSATQTESTASSEELPRIAKTERLAAGWAKEVVYAITVIPGASPVTSVKGPDGKELPLDDTGRYLATIQTNGDYTVTVTDNAGQTVQHTITETQIDTTVPVILELHRMTQGTTQDALYLLKVEDTESGIEDVKVLLREKEISVEENEKGQYTFHVNTTEPYTIVVTDSVGYEVRQTLTDSNISYIAPSFADFARQQSGWQNRSVTYSFRVEDPQGRLVQVICQIDAEEATPLVVGDDGIYNFEVSGNQTVKVTLEDNTGKKIEKTVSETMIDISDPVITELKRQPASWIREAQYTISAEDAESGIASAEVFLHEKPIAVTKGTENGQFHFVAVENGTYTIIVKDVAGNLSQKELVEKKIGEYASAISVQPQQTWDASENSVRIEINDDAEIVTLEVQDAAGTVYPHTGSGKEFTVSLRDNGNYRVVVTNAAGDTGMVDFTINHIDDQAPRMKDVASSAEEGWSNQDVMISAVAEDLQSGIVEYWYGTSSSFDETVWKKMEIRDGTGSVTLTEEQDVIYYIAAKDAVGRMSDPAPIKVQIDKTAPSQVEVRYQTTPESGYNSIVNGTYIYNDRFGFSIAAQDGSSGIAAYEYCIRRENAGDSEWIKVKGNETGISPILNDFEDGKYSVLVRVYDLAGNCSAEETVTDDGMRMQHVIENTPQTEEDRSPAPVAALTAGKDPYNGEWTNQTILARLSGSTAASGIRHYEYAVVHADPSMEDVGWTVIPDSGLEISKDTNAVYSFRAVTYAGNTSQVVQHIVKIQKTLPSAAEIVPDKATGNHGWYTKLPAYAFVIPEYSELSAPVYHEIHYRLTSLHGEPVEEVFVYDGSNAPQITEEGIWDITITAVDAAGNRNTTPKSSWQFCVDTTAPTEVKVLLNGDVITNLKEAETSWNNVVITDVTKVSDFELFRNTEAVINILANGGDSQLEALYYAISKEPISNLENAAWTAYTGEVRLQPDQKCILYFKAVDEAGNTTYFTGRSVILDATAPVGKDGSELTLQPTTENKSEHGIYFGNANVNVAVREPMDELNTFSGIKDVTYQVYRDGVLSQSGTLFPGSGEAEVTEGRTSSWNGQITVDATQNNSNHIEIIVTATDNAGNKKTGVVQDGIIRIDLDAPVIKSYYDNNTVGASYAGEELFTGHRTLTVEVTERNFDRSKSKIYVTETDTGNVLSYTWERYGNGYQAVIPVTDDGHYTVEAVFFDLAGNKTTSLGFVEGPVAKTAFVIDNTKPIITAAFDQNNPRKELYFNTARTLSIHVEERNFNPENMDISVWVETGDGNKVKLPVSNWERKGTQHTATVFCEYNGIYEVEISGSDAVNNQAEETVYTGSAVQRFVIDTVLDQPMIQNVQNTHAYAGDVLPQISATDKYLENVTLKLVRTRRNEIDVDVTGEMLKGIIWNEIPDGKETVLDIFQNDQAIDGIYTLTASCTDYAGNEAETAVTFSVNRFGSVYVYDKLLTETMNSSIQKLTGDLILTEYNPSGLVAGSASIYITRNGTPVSNPVYTVDPILSGSEDPGESGWYEYRYVISQTNFKEDGIYEVVLSTKDLAGNIPENTSENMAIHFSVDNEAPTITSITGMEKTIVKADSISITISAIDNIGLNTVTVYSDGKVLEQWKDLTAEDTVFTVTVSEGLNQHIRVVLTDAAGNMFDTDEEGYEPGFPFPEKITVSSNFFLRFYANQPLFYGTICGVFTVTAIGVLFLFKKKKKNTKENK